MGPTASLQVAGQSGHADLGGSESLYGVHTVARSLQSPGRVRLLASSAHFWRGLRDGGLLPVRTSDRRSLSS